MPSTLHKEELESLLVRVRYNEVSIPDATTDILILLDESRERGWDDAIVYLTSHPSFTKEQTLP